MSLINEVLRKLDQSPGAPGSGSTPSQLQPARGREASSRWLGLLAVALFLVGAGAGSALWWFWYPGQGSPQSAPAQDQGAKAEPAGKESARAGTEQPSSRKAEKQPSAPRGESSGETEEGEAPLEMELPPMAEEDARIRAEPPEPAAQEGSEDSASPPVKRPRTEPRKVALVPAGEQRLVGTESPAEAPDSAGSSASARSSGEGDATPQVQVEVPDSWQQQRKAGELARSGYRALADERYDQAVERLSKARRLAPDRTDVINNLGLAQWQAGSPGKAIQTLTDGLGKYPDNPRMAQNLAHFLLRRGDEGDRETGVQALTTALEAQDRLPLYALVGSLYRKMGQPQQAISIYRSGIARNGAHWRLLVGLGLALEADGQEARAAQVYRRARQELPEDQGKVRESVDARLEALPAADGN